MPTYTTKIKLQDAAREDYALLHTVLRENAFKADPYSGGDGSGSTTATFKPLYFSKQGSIIQEIVDDVLKAARRTGKKFSFTIIRNKN